MDEGKLEKLEGMGLLHEGGELVRLERVRKEAESKEESDGGWDKFREGEGKSQNRNGGCAITEEN